MALRTFSRASCGVVSGAVHARLPVVVVCAGREIVRRLIPEGGIELGKPETAGGKLKPILKNSLIFGSDLTATPLAARIETYFLEEIEGPGAVRDTLRKYLD